MGSLRSLTALAIAQIALALICHAGVARAGLQMPSPKGDSEAFRCRGSLANSATLILIDMTDKMDTGQVEFVKDNFIKSIEWSAINEAVSIVVLHDEPLQKMHSKTFCAPKPERMIDYVSDQPAIIKSQNRRFRKRLESAFDEIIDKYSKRNETKNTLLIEAIAEVNRNVRYNFKNANKKNLIIVSDLYQGSEIISFFKICKSEKLFSSRPLKCPTFEETLSSNARFSNYMIKAAPKFSESDKVVVYYLNKGGRVDRSAEKWWVEYFSRSELPATKLEIIPELQRQ